MIRDLAWHCALYAEFFKKRGDSNQSKGKTEKDYRTDEGRNASGWVKKYEEELAGP